MAGSCGKRRFQREFHIQQRLVNGILLTPLNHTHSSGELVWSREEGLASIVAVEMVDLPSSQSATEGFLSLLDEESNPFLLAYKRVNFQLGLAREFLEGVMKKGVASIIKPVSSEELLRDEFNTRKVIIGITKHNKVN